MTPFCAVTFLREESEHHDLRRALGCRNETLGHPVHGAGGDEGLADVVPKAPYAAFALSGRHVDTHLHPVDFNAGLRANYRNNQPPKRCKLGVRAQGFKS
jgi:hypothetical protein